MKAMVKYISFSMFIIAMTFSCKKDGKKLTVDRVVGEYKYVNDWSPWLSEDNSNLVIEAAPAICEECVEINGLLSNPKLPAVTGKVLKDEIIIPEQIFAEKPNADGGQGGGIPPGPSSFYRFEGSCSLNNLSLKIDVQKELGIQNGKTIEWIDSTILYTVFLEKIE